MKILIALLTYLLILGCDTSHRQTVEDIIFCEHVSEIATTSFDNKDDLSQDELKDIMKNISSSKKKYIREFEYELIDIGYSYDTRLKVDRIARAACMDYLKKHN
jgi:phosphosulfolactate phosphohydrolase-like enzyme